MNHPAEVIQASHAAVTITPDMIQPCPEPSKVPCVTIAVILGLLLIAATATLWYERHKDKPTMDTKKS